MKLINCMMSFVYAHRHNKDDKFLVQSKECIDFTILRDCMYHYSKKAQDRFFGCPTETYFFAKFASSSNAQNFIKSKNNMSSENIRRLLGYIKDLYQVSIESLKRMQGDDLFVDALIDDLGLS